MSDRQDRSLTPRAPHLLAQGRATTRRSHPCTHVDCSRGGSAHATTDLPAHRPEQVRSLRTRLRRMFHVKRDPQMPVSGARDRHTTRPSHVLSEEHHHADQTRSPSESPPTSLTMVGWPQRQAMSSTIYPTQSRITESCTADRRARRRGVLRHGTSEPTKHPLTFPRKRLAPCRRASSRWHGRRHLVRRGGAGTPRPSPLQVPHQLTRTSVRVHTPFRLRRSTTTPSQLTPARDRFT